MAADVGRATLVTRRWSQIVEETAGAPGRESVFVTACATESGSGAFAARLSPLAVAGHRRWRLDVMPGGVRRTSANLLSPVQAAGGSSTSLGWAFAVNIPIAALNLVVGEMISFAADGKTERLPGGNNQVQALVFFFGAGSVNLGSGSSGYIDVTDWQRMAVEGRVIPAGTESISLGIDNINTTNGIERGFARRLMLNRGSAALPFEPPLAAGQQLSDALPIGSTIYVLGEHAGALDGARCVVLGRERDLMADRVSYILRGPM